jgi:diguanylate cyclase (GGDEF)-like protein
MLATIIIETFFIFRPFEIQIQKDFEEIEKNMVLLREQATYDDMTSLFNKRSGMLFLEQEVNKAKRAKTPLTVCFIALDGLKKVNDTYGHEAGDEMIITFAEILKKTIRSSEISFRYGGDEFVIVLLSSIAQAEKTMARVIANVKGKSVFSE